MNQTTKPITVVLPIYRDTAMTVACIESAMPGILTVADATLVAINDASPDSDMQTALAALATRYQDSMTLLLNDNNLGFVATVNRGMKYHDNHDIVLLNSDVLLPDATWLSRLAQDANEADDIASVTPLSNNTTICTFPEFLQDNPLPFGLSVTAIDHAFRGTRYPCVAAPTGVGFCLYIRRQTLDTVGYFDEAAFGRGYGEENDFCQRAIQAGYRNLISPNLYAYHQGGVSFGEEKHALIENACRVIDQRYPNYHSDVQVFIAADPLRTARIQRLATLVANAPLPKILHISHGTGGGVGQHIEELNAYLDTQAIALILVPEGDDGLVKLTVGSNQTADALYFDLDSDYAALVQLLQDLGVGLIHFHHTVRFGQRIFALPDSLGKPHLFTLHDFYLLGGNPTLSDDSGVYPGHFDETLQNPLYPYPKGVSREQFRAQHRRLVESAQLTIFPSQATRDIFSNIYQLNNAAIIPHLETDRKTDHAIQPLPKKERYTVGVLGAISREKGADLLEKMAISAKQNNLPLDFVLLGYAYRSLKHVQSTGPFERQQLTALCQQHQIDIAFFSARWPETYSYTLSYAMDAGLPIFAPNLGAFTERLKQRPLTQLFDHLASAEAIVNQLHAFIQNNTQTTPQTWQVPNAEQAERFYADAYLAYAENLSAVNPDFTPERSIDTEKRPSTNPQTNEKLVVGLWKIYTHPSMRWVNKIVPFRVRRGLKRLLSRQAIHDLVNKYDKK